MTLYDNIQFAIKTAMISKDTVKRDCLRTIVSEIKNQTINANPPREITDDICLKVLQKSAKSHKDSIYQFHSANRTDLVEKESDELAIIEEFLPKMMSEDETRVFVEKYISDNNIEKTKKNMGTIMRGISPVSGFDKKIASKILQSILY